MSRELLKMVGVSVSSSLCTAIFVVACTASANKTGGSDSAPGDGHAEAEGSEHDDGGGTGDGAGDEQDDPGTGEDHPGDDTDDGDAITAAELAELAGQIEDLVAFQTSALCFIGHMTDEQQWVGLGTDHEDYPGVWSDITWGEAVDSYDYGNSGYGMMTQGPNSDAQKAYDDCF